MGALLLTRAHRQLGVAVLAAGLALAPTAGAECPDRIGRLDQVDAAEQKLLEADLAGADLTLRGLEEALACGGVVETDLLARIWLLEGAWLTLKGDPAAATDSWQAAARVAPGAWVEAYGDKLRRAYDAAIASDPGRADAPATLTLDPPLFQWIGAIDGAVTTFPAQVAPGLHLVQVGASVDDIEFARMIVAQPGTASVVTTGVVEPTTAFGLPGAPGGPPAATDDARPPPGPPPVVAVYAAFGTDVAFGKPVPPLDRSGLAGEPGVKLVAPVETGVVVRSGRGWVRAAGTAGPLVGGRFAYSDKFGAATTPTALGAQLAGGISGALGDMGLLVGYSWPDRVPIRAVIVGRVPRVPLQAEARLGLNAALGRTPEPAVGLVVALAPGLFRGRPDADASGDGS